MKTITKQEKASIKILLTDAELRDRGDRLAQHLKAVTDLEAKLTSYKANIKSELEGIAADISMASAAIRERSEMRELDCTIILDFSSGVKRYYAVADIDCMHELDARPLSNADRQLELVETEQAEAEAEVAAIAPVETPDVPAGVVTQGKKIKATTGGVSYQL